MKVSSSEAATLQANTSQARAPDSPAPCSKRQRPGLDSLTLLPPAPTCSSDAAPGSVFCFSAGECGDFRILAIHAIKGPSLAGAQRLAIGSAPQPGAQWHVTGHFRARADKPRASVRFPIHGPESAPTLALLICIKKSAEWYSLSADEKRDVFAQQAQFYSICARTLPRLARRLLHCLDQPDAAFDFIIWTEYTDDQVAQLALVLSILRQSPEWQFVTREVHVQVAKE